MDTTIEYRVERGMMLVRNGGNNLITEGFFTEEPKAHARLKEIASDNPALAQNLFLVAAERLIPTEVSEEPV